MTTASQMSRHNRMHHSKINATATEPDNLDQSTSMGIPLSTNDPMFENIGNSHSTDFFAEDSTDTASGVGRKALTAKAFGIKRNVSLLDDDDVD